MMDVWRPLPSHLRGEKTLIDKGMDLPKVIEVISLELRLESISPLSSPWVFKNFFLNIYFYLFVWLQEVLLQHTGSSVFVVTCVI